MGKSSNILALILASNLLTSFTEATPLSASLLKQHNGSVEDSDSNEQYIYSINHENSTFSDQKKETTEISSGDSSVFATEAESSPENHVFSNTIEQFEYTVNFHDESSPFDKSDSHSIPGKETGALLSPDSTTVFLDADLATNPEVNVSTNNYESTITAAIDKKYSSLMSSSKYPVVPTVENNIISLQTNRNPDSESHFTSLNNQESPTSDGEVTDISVTGNFETAPSKDTFTETKEVVLPSTTNLINELLTTNFMEVNVTSTTSRTSSTKKDANYTEITYTSTVVKDSDDGLEVTLEDVTSSNPITLGTQSLSTELPVATTFSNFNDSSTTTDILSVSDLTSTVSNFSNIEVSTESSTISLDNEELETELLVTATFLYLNDSITMPDINVPINNSISTDLNYTSTENPPATSNISSGNDAPDWQPFVTEFPKESAFPSVNDSVFVFNTQKVTDSSYLSTKDSAESTTVFPAEEYHTSSPTIDLSSSTEDSTTNSNEITTFSNTTDNMVIINAESSTPGTVGDFNNSTDGGDSLCTVCQDCTDSYIDRVISDVTASLPPFLELPNRQGRFQLYHGRLFGMNSLKRSEPALVACPDKHHYAVMVPLRIRKAKAFYRWQVEMPLRTFYGDFNVTVDNTECRVFYSHSKGGSHVEGLKITAMDDIDTQFSGLKPLNGMLAGLARALIGTFRRSFARAIENTLMQVINTELQDVRKYEEYHEIKE